MMILIVAYFFWATLFIPLQVSDSTRRGSYQIIWLRTVCHLGAG